MTVMDVSSNVLYSKNQIQPNGLDCQHGHHLLRPKVDLKIEFKRACMFVLKYLNNWNLDASLMSEKGSP